jgi:4-diphosphocytidyl-2-C-methyl-D-erythritol kinase
VSFLDSGLGLALVKGRGEQFFCRKMKKGLSFMIFIPAWSSATREAYEKLDRYFLDEGFPKNESEAVQEAEDLISKIEAGISVGLLPNDFLPVLMQDRPEYGKLFDLLEDTDSTAWGVTGSGSAAFAIFNDPSKEDMRGLNGYFSSLSWLRKTFLWSDDQ